MAAHWKYKEGTRGRDTFEEKLARLRQQMFEWTGESADARDFIRTVTDDLFGDQVYAFTPKSEVIDLPAGSTPVDFAYKIHSDIGHTCVGAKVNGRIVPLNYQLKSGDIVEILHRPGATPSFDWLSFVKSAHARSKIKAWFRKQQRASNIARGRDLLEKEVHRLGLSGSEVLRDEELKRVALSFNLSDVEDLMESVGSGAISASTVLRRIARLLQADGASPQVAAPGKTEG